MPLVKSTGNMYSWVDCMHTHLGGECPHKCSYCYANTSYVLVEKNAKLHNPDSPFLID